MIAQWCGFYVVIKLSVYVVYICIPSKSYVHMQYSHLPLIFKNGSVNAFSSPISGRVLAQAVLN